MSVIFGVIGLGMMVRGDYTRKGTIIYLALLAFALQNIVFHTIPSVSVIATAIKYSAGVAAVLTFLYQLFCHIVCVHTPCTDDNLSFALPGAFATTMLTLAIFVSF